MAGKPPQDGEIKSAFFTMEITWKHHSCLETWNWLVSGTFSRVFARMPRIYACGSTCFLRRKFDGNVEKKWYDSAENAATETRVNVMYPPTETCDCRHVSATVLAYSIYHIAFFPAVTFLLLAGFCYLIIITIVVNWYNNKKKNLKFKIPITNSRSKLL